MRHSSLSPHPYHYTSVHAPTRKHSHTHTCRHIHTFDSSHRNRHKQLPPEVAAAAAPAPPNQCANNKAVNFCMRLNKLYIFVFSVEKVFQSWVVLSEQLRYEKYFHPILLSWFGLTGQSLLASRRKRKVIVIERKREKENIFFVWSLFVLKIAKPSCLNGDFETESIGNCDLKYMHIELREKRKEKSKCQLIIRHF